MEMDIDNYPPPPPSVPQEEVIGNHKTDNNVNLVDIKEDKLPENDTKVEEVTNIENIVEAVKEDVLAPEKKKEEDDNIVKILTTITNDELKELVTGYGDNLVKLENMALECINEIQHPFFTIYRDVTKNMHLSNIVNKFKNNTEEEALEQAIAFLSILDYLATCYNNALYPSHISKCSFYDGIIAKAIKFLRKSLHDWGVSDLKHKKSQYELLKRNLVNIGKKISDSGLFDKCSRLLEITILSVEKNSRRSSRKLNTRKKSNKLASPRVILNEIQIKEKSPEKEGGIQKEDSKDNEVKADDSNSRPKAMHNSTIKNYFSNENPKKRPAETEAKRDSTDEENSQEVILITSTSPIKRARIETADVEKLVKPNEPENKSKNLSGLNAFQIMMNKSRELSKINKDKKQQPVSNKPKTPKSKCK